MSKNPKKSVAPSYRFHKARNCAIVRIHGEDYYLGEYGSSASKQLYAQLIAEKWAGGSTDEIEQNTAHLPASRKVWPSIDELIASYMTKHVAHFHVDRNGNPSERQYHVKLALRPLHDIYGHTPVNEFGSKRLKVVREQMILAGLEEKPGGYSRQYVNDHVAIIKNFFRWGVEEELVPVEIHQSLLAVQQLRKGREGRVRDQKKVPPVAREIVEATLPYLMPQLVTMVKLQLYTAMRPDEVTIMRLSDIDQTGEIWVYTPHGHKTEHHGLSRPVYLGPKCQELLQPWLDRPADAYFFSPREVVAATRAKRRKKSSKGPEKLNYQRAPRVCYDDETYCRAVKRACVRAGVAKWTPNQLRHTRSTEIRSKYNLEAAKIILGHQSTVTTETYYAEKDMQIAINIMKEIG